MIHPLLIVSRSEIACRIIRTARTMGIRTAAPYSDAKALNTPVKEAPSFGVFRI